MANELTPWTPPESKTMQKVVSYGGLVAGVVIGIYAFTRFAPTLVDAVRLFDTLLQDSTHMALSAVGLVAVLWFGRELISPAGAINKLLRMPYWMLINGLTRFFITIDPLSPITERLKAVRADQATFEKQFETLDGLIDTLRDKEQDYRDRSAKAQRMGVAASKQGATAAKELAVHNFGSFKEAADSYAVTRARLEPIRSTFQQISQACDITAQKLTTERDILADKWKTQQAVRSATDAANRVLGRSRSQTWDLAEQAESLINTKYSEELGHLDHLKRYAEPFLESIDVESGAYSEDMFQQVQNAGAKLIESTAATQVPQIQAPQSSSVLSSLINN